MMIPDTEVPICFDEDGQPCYRMRAQDWIGFFDPIMLVIFYVICLTLPLWRPGISWMAAISGGAVLLVLFEALRLSKRHSDFLHFAITPTAKE